MRIFKLMLCTKVVVQKDLNIFFFFLVLLCFALLCFVFFLMEILGRNLKDPQLWKIYHGSREIFET